MKKFIKYLALAVLFAVAGAAQADQGFIRITTTPDYLGLGEFIYPGLHKSSAELTVKIESSGLHGPILASITKLKSTGGSIIEPEQILVKSPASNDYIPMKGSVVISKPTIGSHNVVLTFKVRTDFDDPAGNYSGTLVFTIVPP